jgi:hypothetical protein
MVSFLFSFLNILSSFICFFLNLFLVSMSFSLLQEFNEFRSKCGLLWSFDWVSLPLVYTQVLYYGSHICKINCSKHWKFCSKSFYGCNAEHLFQVVTIATYSFFLAALVGRQYVEENRKNYQMEVDIYVPLFTILQFFFYMGLLKVTSRYTEKY